MEGFYRPAITTFSGPGWSQFLDYDAAVLEAALEFIRDRSAVSDRDPFCLVVGFHHPTTGSPARRRTMTFTTAK